MKITKTRFIAAAAALMFALSAASCGREVPKDTQPATTFSVAGGTVESTTEPVTTAPDESEETTEKPTAFVEGGGRLSGVTLSYNEAEVFVGQTITYPVVYDSFEEVWSSSDEKIATVDSVGNITGKSEGTCIVSVADKNDDKKGAEVKVKVTKDKGVKENNGVTYVDGILIANKSYGLPESYNPGGLTPETDAAFKELVAGAAANGISIYLSSGFRSYDLQSQIYNNYVNAYGQATADTFSARPGYSEHQTGMAIDVNIIDDTFIGTPEAIWIEQHCNEYGFILRYPFGKQDITGYKYEPWHIRYIGKENAEAFAKEADKRNDVNLTLEEYLDIDSYYH